MMLYLESFRMGCVISESCYKGTILQRNYRKMTMLFLCKIPWYTNLEPQHDGVLLYRNLCYKEICYKGTAL